MKNLQEIRKEYKLFIDDIPNYIHMVRIILNKDKLTYLPDEIDLLSKIYEHNFKNPEKLTISRIEFRKMFVAYLGTAHLWHFGGIWTLVTSKDAQTYGHACVEQYGGKTEDGKEYPWITISPDDWVFFIETQQLDESLGRHVQKADQSSQAKTTIFIGTR